MSMIKRDEDWYDGPLLPDVILGEKYQQLLLEKDLEDIRRSLDVWFNSRVERNDTVQIGMRSARSK